MEIGEIVVGKRHREDLGDLEDLKRSISELGLLQPVVLKKGTKELVAGYRRLCALRQLGITSLVEGKHCILIDIQSLVRGEHDENICRKDLSISEKVAVFEAIKAEQLRINIEKNIVSGAMAGRGNGDGGEKMHWRTGTRPEMPGADKTGPDVRPQGSGRNMQSRAVAARAVGLHQNTLRKAAEIVAAAKRDPQRYGSLVREMDATGKVEPVFQKYVRRRSCLSSGKYVICGSLAGPGPAIGCGVPEFLQNILTCIPPERQEDLVKHFGDVFGLVKQVDLDRAIRSFSSGEDAAALSENEVYQAVHDALEHTAMTAGEWVFMPQVRQIASVVMGVTRAQGPVSLLDKLDLFMIGLAVFVDMACSYLQVANKEGIIRKLPADALEKYLAVIDAFKMLYESKLPRQVGVLRMREYGLCPGEVPGTKTVRDRANAMNANEMITDAAEGDIPYYGSLIANLIKSCSEGAQRLAEAGGNL